ncbi:MAG: phospholipase D-like domain-containing protein [Cyanobacteria bacterium]|nr:phospholipase D-like domain-containing protein [Cyanobacteriota bacterium]
MPSLADHQWRRRFSSSLQNLLDGFYQPALQHATRYWRVTGYFTSRSLLQVLEGVENLVAASPDGLGHGQMRLITGVFLSEKDIAALAAGTPAEAVLTDHLSSHFPFKGVEPGGPGAAALGAELLAWLVSRGHLEIRVGLPLTDGRIVNDGAIFHAKEGVIEDQLGQRLGFSGSVNETPNGWTSNFETIQTFCSWKPGGAEDIDELEAGFLRLWENHDDGARTFTLPEAIRQQLAIFQPTEGVPRRLKPFLKDLPAPEPEPVFESVHDIDERRRIVWSYVLQAAASDLPGAERVGEGTRSLLPIEKQSA